MRALTPLVLGLSLSMLQCHKPKNDSGKVPATTAPSAIGTASPPMEGEVDPSVPHPPGTWKVSVNEAMRFFDPPKDGGMAVGTMSSEDLQRVVHTKYKDFRDCYEQIRHMNPTFDGKANIVVRFAIDEQGHVPQATIPPDLDPHSAVGELSMCIRYQFAQMLFPAPQGGAVGAEYVFQFDAKQE